MSIEKTIADTAIDSRQRNRNRLLLVGIFAIFFGGLLIAGALRFSGWQPSGMKNRGELLSPSADLRALVPRLDDGSAYRWAPVERRWRIALAPPADCAAACVELARELDLVWQLFGKDADRVDILWIGTPPPPGATRGAATRLLRADAALRARLPRVDDPRGVPVYVVDPNGFVILRYAPGTDPGDLRADLSKLLKLM
ncbi:MAG: hypothetical protein ACREO8_01990 [Luteimonas sp.]